MVSLDTRKLLQGFLGMFNYCLRLCPTSKINIQPFASLTSPKVKFKWNKEDNASFNNIKSMLANDVLLVCPDFDNPFHLDTDASNNPLGGIIYQYHGNMVYYYSRLTKC